jgi:hypothetical protein
VFLNYQFKMQLLFEMIGTHFSLFLFSYKRELVSLTSTLLEIYHPVCTAVNSANISCDILFTAVKIIDGSKGINHVYPSQKNSVEKIFTSCSFTEESVPWNVFPLRYHSCSTLYELLLSGIRHPECVILSTVSVNIAVGIFTVIVCGMGCSKPSCTSLSGQWAGSEAFIRRIRGSGCYPVGAAIMWVNEMCWWKIYCRVDSPQRGDEKIFQRLHV